MTESIVNAFLRRLSADRRHGIRRPLDEYQRLFPGHEALLAREWDALEGPGAKPIFDPGPAPGTPEVGGRIGNYLLREELGRGGQGMVFAAEDTVLHRVVALKVLERIAGLAPEAVQRFQREARVQASLEHPNICAVYEAGEADGVRFIAMRRVGGPSLAALVASARSGTPLPGEVAPPVARLREDLKEGRTRAVLGFLLPVARALGAAHEAGIVHRDVKAANILVETTGVPLLSDFGLARGHQSQQVTGSGDLLGTPAYLAPEQLRGGEPGSAADVFSFGVVLYECLTLRRPFQGVQREALFRSILEDDPPDPRRTNRDLSRDARTVIEKALAKDPRRRYRSAVELACEIGRLVDGEPVSARPVSNLGRGLRVARRHPWFSAALVVALFLSGVGAWFAGRWQEVRRGREAELAAWVSEELARGYDALTEESSARAERIFAEVLDRDPRSPLAVAGLVLAGIGSDPARALRELELRSRVLDDPRVLDHLAHDLRRRLGMNELPADPEPRGPISDFVRGNVLLLHSRTGRDRFAEAAAAFRDAVAWPGEDHPFYYYGLAEALGEAERPDEAKAVAGLLLIEWPASRPARYYAARAIREADPERSLSLLETLIDDPGIALRAHQAAARILLVRRRDPNGAAHHLDRIDALSPQSFEALTLRIQWHQLRRESREARALATCLTDRYETLGKSWVLRGQLAAEEGRLDEARSCFEAGVARDPLYWRAYALLGWVSARQGEVESALDALGKAVDAEPSAARPRCDRGLLLLALRCDGEAEADLRLGLDAREPQSEAAARRGLAVLALLRGAPEEALSTLAPARPPNSDRDLRRIRRALRLAAEDATPVVLDDASEDRLLTAIRLEGQRRFAAAAEAWRVATVGYSASPMDHPAVRAAICLLRARRAGAASEDVTLERQAVDLLTSTARDLESKPKILAILREGLARDPDAGPLLRTGPSTTPASWAELASRLGMPPLPARR